MKRVHSRSSFDLTLIPTPEEFERYNPKTDGYCCTEERFRPDLNSAPGTPWHKSAIKVFARSFDDSDEFKCEDIHKIKKVFTTHLRHLVKKYKRSISGDAAKLAAKKRANREERKRGVSAICRTFYDCYEQTFYSSSTVD